jgi:putative membrane protein
MKHSILAAVSIAALALSACGSNTAPDADATPTAAATDDMAMAPDATAASSGQMFANTAATSDMFEIESSRLAATKASSAQVKSFAQEMIKAHTDASAKLTTAAGAATPAITPAPAMSAMQQQAMADLNAKTGADFDAAYIKAQTDGHQMTLDALKAYAASGDVASLKAFATEMVPIVTAHLNMAKGLK